ncbi:hypothetical protein WMF38_13865 [Sorangium sp. So ce118]
MRSAAALCSHLVVGLALGLARAELPPIDLATWMYMLVGHTAYLGGTEACSPFALENVR